MFEGKSEFALLFSFYSLYNLFLCPGLMALRVDEGETVNFHFDGCFIIKMSMFIVFKKTFLLLVGK
jgi:hypothetical protein